jgi:hypothetical protein
VKPFFSSLVSLPIPYRLLQDPSPERERMVTEVTGGEEGGTEMEDKLSSKDLQQQSMALDKLTDPVVDDRQLDSSRVQEVV